MDVVYENIEEEDPNKNAKYWLYQIADMLSNKTVQLIVNELFFRGRKLNISLVFYHTTLFWCFYFDVNSTHNFIMKIPSKRQLQQIAVDDAPEIDFKDFLNPYK